jgi:hypothetical protein
MDWRCGPGGKVSVCKCKDLSLNPCPNKKEKISVKKVYDETQEDNS